MGIPLIIGPDEREKIKNLIQYAERHPYNTEKLIKIAEGILDPPGDNDNFVVIIPHGFRCVFTVEYQKPGLMRHLSISVAKKGRYPNEHAVQMIANEFGFTGELEDWFVYGEKEVEAINVMQIVAPMVFN